MKNETVNMKSIEDVEFLEQAFESFKAMNNSFLKGLTSDCGSDYKLSDKINMELFCLYYPILKKAIKKEVQGFSEHSREAFYLIFKFREIEKFYNDKMDEIEAAERKNGLYYREENHQQNRREIV